MYVTDLIRRSSRSIQSAKARTLLTALAIAVGAFSLTLTLAASNGAQNFVDKIIQDNFDPAELIVANDDRVMGEGGDINQPMEYDPSYGDANSTTGANTQIKRMTADNIKEIEKIEAVEQVRKDIAINLQYVTKDGEEKYIGTVAPFNEYQEPATVAGEIPQSFEDNQLILPEAWVDSLGFTSAEDAVGEELTFVLRPTQPSPENHSVSENYQVEQNAGTGHSEVFTITAVTEEEVTTQPGTGLYLLVGQEDAERLNEINTKNTDDFERYNFIYARIAGGGDETVLRAAQEEIEELGYTAQSVQDTQDFLNQIIAVLQGIVVAFGLIAIVASIFGIINTMYISVLQRTREIGLLKALGMHSRDVGRLFRFEAAWIGFLGGVIGSLLAIALGIAINPWLSEQLQLGDDNYLLLFEAAQIIGLIGALTIISIVAGWLPSRKAARLDPIEALRTE